ncbi:MAG: T9SS type A sorting domain-containing protein [Bacteroidales bacterium]
MKNRLFILSMAFVFSLNMKAQISLTQSNTNFTIGVLTAKGADTTGFIVPAPGVNKQWNFSNLLQNSSSTFYHVNPSNINFPTATYADTSNSAVFVPGWYYYYDSYSQTSANGANTLGFVLKNQRYGVAITGNPNDSCIFLSQYFIYSSPSYTMPFPTTMSTSWHTTLRSLVKFDLTINAYSIINAPCQKVTNTIRTDTVVGRGKMRVQTTSGPSFAYDVLMVKRTQVQTDSFYMNGLAASPTLLTAFGVSQGQSTTDMRYIFWRENARYPLLMINFGSNNFTKAGSVFYDATAQFDPSGIAENYQNLDIPISPNPNHGDFTIAVDQMSKEIMKLNIYNVFGQIVHTQSLNPSVFNTEKIHIGNLNAGNYFISIISDKKRWTSKIIVH